MVDEYRYLVEVFCHETCENYTIARANHKETFNAHEALVFAALAYDRDHYVKIHVDKVN